MNRTRSHLPLLISISTLLIALSPRIASAQPAIYDEEPGYLIHVTPAPPVAMAKAPCQPCRPPSSFTVKLEASVGYGGYLGPLFLDKTHGPQLNGAVVLSWGRGTQIGVRVGGFVSQQNGSFEPLFDGERRDVAPRLYGGHVAVQASFRNGFWLAKGFGVLHYDRDTASSPNLYGGSDDSSITLPELVLSGGYDLHLGRHLALQFSLEAATGFFATLRGAANVGLLLKF